MAYDHLEQTELILRDKLAIDRTRLANERTVLAYLRTAFMLIIAGGTAIKLFGESSTAVVSGWAFVALGVAVALLGGWRFLVMRRAIQCVMPPQPDVPAPRDPS